MTRIALVSAACAFAMAISATVAAEEPAEDVAAKDAAVVKACLDVAEARRVEAAEAADAVSPDDAKTEEKAGPEGHLEAAARVAGYAAESCIGVLADPCMETEEAASTYGMMNCYGRESEVWDAGLTPATANAWRRRQARAPMPRPRRGGEAIAQNPVRMDPRRDATCEVLYSDGIPIYGSLARVDARLLRHGAHGAAGPLDGGDFNAGFRVSGGCSSCSPLPFHGRRRSGATAMN